MRLSTGVLQQRISLVQAEFVDDDNDDRFLRLHRLLHDIHVVLHEYMR